MKYDPDQPGDERGRWTSGDGSDAGGAVLTGGREGADAPSSTKPVRLAFNHDGSVRIDAGGGILPAADGASGDKLISDQVAQEIIIPGRTPILPRGTGPRFKIPRSGISDAEGAKDIPSWARGLRPYVGESGRDFAKRVLDEKYGPGNWDKNGREFNQLRKFGDRSFRDPDSVILDDDQA